MVLFGRASYGFLRSSGGEKATGGRAGLVLKTLADAWLKSALHAEGRCAPEHADRHTL